MNREPGNLQRDGAISAPDDPGCETICRGHSHRWWNFAPGKAPLNSRIIVDPREPLAAPLGAIPAQGLMLQAA